MNYEVNYPIQLATVIDCAKTKLSTTALEVGELPQGFVATGIVYDEITKVGTSAALTVKGGTTSLGTVTTGASESAKACGYAVIEDGAFFKEGAKLTVGLGSGASDITAGRIRIGICGFLSGVTAVVTSAGDNKATPDEYTPPESR